ncbi:hypothetical protein OPKNFCMD_2617 [Methylobacterium crusticola]|uniref:Uncharacterized protein n=1 Tax=Methylobacterium crusticola TaxID=1697972 RepID=A0ABQ4QZ10_9HYPH|nr:hypothetical protein OPKNFCMD_2617 [Methylobacterium crusticola]
MLRLIIIVLCLILLVQIETAFHPGASASGSEQDDAVLSVPAPEPPPID